MIEFKAYELRIRCFTTKQHWHFKSDNHFMYILDKFPHVTVNTFKLDNTVVTSLTIYALPENCQLNVYPNKYDDNIIKIEMEVK